MCGAAGLFCFSYFFYQIESSSDPHLMLVYIRCSHNWYLLAAIRMYRQNTKVTDSIRRDGTAHCSWPSIGMKRWRALANQRPG
jgi:hypothetical protein